MERLVSLKRFTLARFISVKLTLAHFSFVYFVLWQRQQLQRIALRSQCLHLFTQEFTPFTVLAEKESSVAGIDLRKAMVVGKRQSAGICNNVTIND